MITRIRYCIYRHFCTIFILDKSTFTQVTTNINNDVKQIACGFYHTFILKNDGSLWSCGANGPGQLGLGTSGNSANQTSFTQVTTNINNDVKQIACGSSHTFILKNDGSVWGCGSNEDGELGLNDTTYIDTFTQVTTNINNDVKQISCGQYHTFILKNDGSVWSCGDNNWGQLGLGLNDTTDKTTFTQVTTNINNDVTQIACGGYYYGDYTSECTSTFILKNDGSVWACGSNYYGQLGLSDTTYNTFTQISIGSNKIVCYGGSQTFIMKNNGDVWVAGAGLGLGINNTNNITKFTMLTKPWNTI